MHPERESFSPQWDRESRRPWSWNPGAALLASIRGYQRWRAMGGPFARLLRMWCVLRHRRWSLVTGSEIPLNAQLGGGLLIPHPNGIIIHPEAKIGPNCLILQQVTIGVGKLPGLPTIGAHVDIGAGAKILGGVTIGDRAKIGANAVVLQNVPSGATAVGIPARIIEAQGPRPH